MSEEVSLTRPRNSSALTFGTPDDRNNISKPSSQSVLKLTPCLSQRSNIENALSARFISRRKRDIWSIAVKFWIRRVISDRVTLETE